MNIFDASVTLHLIDRVSGAMGQIGLSMARTQTAADALNAKMSLVHAKFSKGLLFAGAGAALAAPILIAAHHAEAYVHQLNQMNAAGLTQKELSDSISASWKTTNSVITSTATENLKVIMDLRSVFGKTSEGIEYMPTFAKMQGAYAGVLDGKLSGRADELTFAAAKALDMVGKVNNREEFNTAINAMFRVTEATGGRVTPADYQTTYKYARQAKFGFDDTFRYKVLPELMLENKGGNGASGGVGPQLAALYRFGIQGIMNKRSGQSLVEMGMVPASSILKTTTSGTTLKGPVEGGDMLRANPFKWVQEVFIPRLASRFKIDPSQTDKLVEASNQIFRGNQLAGNLVGELIKKQQQYSRFSGLYDKTMTMEQAYKFGLGNDPKMAKKAFSAAWEDLSTAIGKVIYPILIPAMVGTAQAIQKVATYLQNNPGMAKAIVGVTSFASGLLLLGGAFNIVSAGFMGLRLIAGGLVAAFAGLSAPAWIAIAAITAAGIAIYTWRKPIMDWVHKHSPLLIHAMAQAGQFAEGLGKTIMGLAKSFMGFMGQIASSPFIKALVPSWLSAAANNAAKGLDDMNKGVGAAQQQKDEAWLRAHGAQQVIDIAKGAAAPVSTAKAPPPVINQTNHFHVDGSKDPKATAQAINDHMQNLMGKIGHTSSAISRAGGVPKSRIAYGAGQ